MTLQQPGALHTIVWVVARRGGLLDHTPTPGEWRERMINGLAPAAVDTGFERFRAVQGEDFPL